MLKRPHFITGFNDGKELQQLKEAFSANFKYDMDVIHGFTDMEELLRLKQPDFIICDLKLRDGDAISFAHSMKNKSMKGLPYFIVLSEDLNPFIQTAAYNGGINDFYSKPFSEKNLALKIKNLLNYFDKKIAKPQASKKFVVDEEKYCVIRNESTYYLPGKEFEIIKLLNQQPSKIYTRQEIAEHVWGNADVARTRIIDVHVTHMRKVLGKESIRSIKKRGYGLNNE